MRRSGFSLVEVLLALTIMLVLGGSVTMLLLRSFKLWHYGSEQSRGLVPLEQTITTLARDFAATVGGLGFTGEVQRCNFTTRVAHGVGSSELQQVAYSFAHGEGMRQWRHYQMAEGAQVVYRPLPQLTLRYGAGPYGAEAWRDMWQSHSNAPTRLMVQAADGRSWLLLRRTP